MADFLERLRALTGRLPLDRHAASRATLFALLAVVALFGLQVAVTAAFTAPGQPVASVDQVPVQPQAGGWADAPEQTVELNTQQMAIPYGGGSVGQVDVKALTNESHVAVRLEWDDPTRDGNIASPENYSDAGAVMFGTGEMPPIMMGAVGQPVNIWYWRASWQDNKSAYGSGGMYGYPHDRANATTMPGRAVDNPLSRAAYEQRAQNYYAEGFGSTSNAPSQPVTASATRTDDGWAVTFVRERVSDAGYDVNFTQGKDIYMAFAVWNGSQDERNGQKSITLQYRKLDPVNGTLSQVESGGGSGTGGDGSDAGSGGSGGSGGGGMSLTGWASVLVVSTLLVWMVTYWRFYE